MGSLSARTFFCDWQIWFYEIIVNRFLDFSRGRNKVIWLNGGFAHLDGRVKEGGAWRIGACNGPNGGFNEGRQLLRGCHEYIRCRGQLWWILQLPCIMLSFEGIRDGYH